jgi:hypothetical protein
MTETFMRIKEGNNWLKKEIFVSFYLKIFLMRIVCWLLMKNFEKLSNTKGLTDSKHFLLLQNDVHNYKITGILKQLKFR